MQQVTCVFPEKNQCLSTNLLNESFSDSTGESKLHTTSIVFLIFFTLSLNGIHINGSMLMWDPKFSMFCSWNELSK